VAIDENRQDELEVTGTQNEQPIEALGTDRPTNRSAIAFACGVCFIWAPGRRSPD
jgi:hypothetical protein